MKRSEKLKESLKPLYKELVSSVGEFANTCFFAMQWGDKFPLNPNEGVLFVGRATNGWISAENNLDVLFGADDQAIFNREDQRQWIEEKWGNPDEEDNNYNTLRSSFWKVIRMTSIQLYPELGEEWYRKVAWSNLYKAAPLEGGNPSNAMCRAQLESSQKILAKEIEILSPKTVVMLTGYNWAKDFLSSLNNGVEPSSCKMTKEWDNYASSLYVINGVNYIVTEHPQGKKHQAHIDALLELIS